MFILPRGYTIHNIPLLTINGQELSSEDKYKYIGIITLNTCMDDQDMRSLYIRGHFISRHYFLVNIQLFKTFVLLQYV